MADLVIDSALSLEDVLTRLDARASEWRESTLPAVLRAEGIYGVNIRRHGAEFRMQSRGGRRRPYVPVLVGRIDARSEGGSRVHARFWPSRRTLGLGAIMLAWLVGLTVMGGGLGFFAIALLLMTALFGIGVAIAQREQQGLTAILRDIAGVSDSSPTLRPTTTKSTQSAV